MFEILKDFQTGIVGIIGFIGVILTLKQNAKIVREERMNQIAHERKAVRTAICSELECMRDAFKDRIRTMKKGEGDSALIPKNKIGNVLDGLIDKIGLLSLEEITLILKAHALVKELPERLSIMCWEVSDTDALPGYIFINGGNIQTAIEMHENFLVKIDSAIASLREQMDAT